MDYVVVWNEIYVFHGVVRGAASEEEALSLFAEGKCDDIDSLYAHELPWTVRAIPAHDYKQPVMWAADVLQGKEIG